MEADLIVISGGSGMAGGVNYHARPEAYVIDD